MAKKTNGTTILTRPVAHKIHGYSTGMHGHKIYEEEMMTKQNKYKNLGAIRKAKV